MHSLKTHFLSLFNRYITMVRLDRQSICCKLPHGLLAILAIDVESFCDNQSIRRLQLRPFGSVKLLKPEQPATLWLFTTPSSTPLEVLVVWYKSPTT